MIPGMNLLQMAFSLIGTQAVKYFKYDSYEILDDGTRVSKFKDPVELTCCQLQPVDRSRYNELGLSFQRSYWDFWSSTPIEGVDRGYSGDVIEWKNRRFQISSETPWYALDDWNYALLIDIGPATGNTTEPCVS